MVTPYPLTPLHPGVFDPSAGCWQVVRDNTVVGNPLPTSTLTVVTWNVWFGALHPRVRATTLLDIVHDCAPDVVCLQEVTPDFLDGLLCVPWVRDGYAVSALSHAAVDPYGVVVLTRLPLRSIASQELPGSMGRTLLMATVTVNDRPVTVGTVHLESRAHNADVRGEQLAVALPVLRAMDHDAVLVGDFNMADDARDEPTVPTDFVDVWQTLRSLAPGYTVDTDVNAMTAHDRGHTRQARYDRVLVHTPRRELRPTEITLLGTTPLAEPGVFPSDHFGLCARFTVGG